MPNIYTDLLQLFGHSWPARIDGMAARIIGLCAAGLTVRDIQSRLLDLYGLKVSPDLISRVTDAVLNEVRDWQSRAPERMYPIRDLRRPTGEDPRCRQPDGEDRASASPSVRDRWRGAVYVALGVTRDVTRDGLREVLGLWIAGNEGARFWLPVMNALKTRGTQDILIAIVDGLKGFPEAITAALPEAMVQTLNFCSWKDRKAVAADLRRIHGAATADLAAAEIDDFEEKWAGKHASITQAWRRAWRRARAEVIPFRGFDPAIARASTRPMPSRA